MQIQLKEHGVCQLIANTSKELDPIREYFKNWIERFGEAITIYNVSSTSYSSRYHDATTTYDSGTSSFGVVVPETSNLMKEMEGELERAGLTMLIPYNQTISNKSKVTLNSKDYEVVEVREHSFQGQNTAYLVMLSRLEST